jgi:hypothetical protein
VCVCVCVDGDVDNLPCVCICVRKSKAANDVTAAIFAMHTDIRRKNRQASIKALLPWKREITCMKDVKWDKEWIWTDLECVCVLRGFIMRMIDVLLLLLCRSSA